MKKIYSLLALFLFAGLAANAQTMVCDSTGNLIIYSNYDGGVLNIDVDQNIPNLKIGVVSYEPVTINISGTYVGNVTEVRYAGYVATNNMHCNNSPTTTTINGVSSSITSVNFLPVATYSNPNGYSSIVCNYSCSISTNQGGCNTADQVVDYFQNTTGGTFRFHFTQYGCWPVNPVPVSYGGNCCAAPPVTTALQENDLTHTQIFRYNGNLVFQNLPENDPAHIELIDMKGETVHRFTSSGTSAEISLAGMSAGIYLVRVEVAGQQISRKVQL